MKSIDSNTASFARPNTQAQAQDFQTLSSSSGPSSSGSGSGDLRGIVSVNPSRFSKDNGHGERNGIQNGVQIPAGGLTVNTSRSVSASRRSSHGTSSTGFDSTVVTSTASSSSTSNSNSNSSSNAGTTVKNSGGSRGAAKLFRSATKGMMKVLGVAKPSASASSSSVTYSQREDTETDTYDESGSPDSRTRSRASISYENDTDRLRSGHADTKTLVSIFSEVDTRRRADIPVPTPILTSAVTHTAHTYIPAISTIPPQWPPYSSSSPSSPLQRGAVAGSVAQGGGSYPAPLTEMLFELESLREPIRSAQNRARNAMEKSAVSVSEATVLLTSAQEVIGKAAIGLAAVKVLGDEVNRQKAFIESASHTAVRYSILLYTSLYYSVFLYNYTLPFFFSTSFLSSSLPLSSRCHCTGQ